MRVEGRDLILSNGKSQEAIRKNKKSRDLDNVYVKVAYTDVTSFHSSAPAESLVIGQQQKLKVNCRL